MSEVKKQTGKQHHKCVDRFYLINVNLVWHQLVVYSGGAYMPIDISYPATLIDDIIVDAKPVAICVQEDMAGIIGGSCLVNVHQRVNYAPRKDCRSLEMSVWSLVIYLYNRPFWLLCLHAKFYHQVLTTWSWWTKTGFKPLMKNWRSVTWLSLKLMTSHSITLHTQCIHQALLESQKV